MFAKLMKRFFESKQEKKTDADVKIATLEKEVTELKAKLEHQMQKAENAPVEVKSTLNSQHISNECVSPVKEKKAPDCQKEADFASFMGISFHNRVLKGTWRGKGTYVQENGKMLSGEIVLEIDQCDFYIPPDRMKPYVRISINHEAAQPIGFEEKKLTIASNKGTYAFFIQDNDIDKLLMWLKKRLPELEKVCKFPVEFLASSNCGDGFAHPFFEKHAVDNVTAKEYFRLKFPVFGKPISWYTGTTSICIEEDGTCFYVEPYLSGEAWTWTETERQIKIVLSILEVGFFDDSESEFRFEYTISYLGDCLNDDESVLINNAKLQLPLPLSKWSKTGEDKYIAAHPFGLNGFYKIEWKASKR